VSERLVQVILPWATFGLVVTAGRVTLAPPVAGWAAGRDEREVAAYYRQRGARLCVVPASGNENHR
jgi:hypothetical protein